MQHPYKSSPDSARWKISVANLIPSEVDPVSSPPFKIDKSAKLVTAGSCFAQHIARHLKASGYNYFMTEPPHPIMSDDIAKTYNYGTFSARYGNIYTTRQLLQLFDRAFDKFEPRDSIWRLLNGRYVDALRPRITPNGYSLQRDVEADREYHLTQVRRLFRESEVFVFTLGLTEAWVSNLDGTVYPLCPGVAGGEFSNENYTFKNFDVDAVYDDLAEFATKLRIINPQVKFLLTVSPVPLIATATTEHVLAATTYSKAVLRVVAERFVLQFSDAYYFPSYEIITGSYTRGKYFADDLRSVTEEGVGHVMRLFFKHLAVEGLEDSPIFIAQQKDEHTQKMQGVIDTACDEEALDGVFK